MRGEVRFVHERVWRLIGLLTLLVILFTLAACQPTPNPSTPNGDGTLTRPDLVGLIEWDRSPTTIVFRAQQTGGDTTSFLRLGDVPDCTIFGDNSMIYLLPGAENGTLVAVDKVPDEAIRTFVEDLTLNQQLFSQTSGIADTSAELLPPVYELLSISINGQSFTFDSLAGWDEGYYADVVERCHAVSVAPAEFVPEDGAWVSVRTVTYNPDQPALTWQATATGIDLPALADGERQWLKGQGVVALWDMLRSSGSNLQIQQDELTYQAVIQVPGITLNAPAAP